MPNEDQSEAELRRQLHTLRQQQAQEQAAERIRAEVSSMRSTQDLTKVLGLMHQEMIHLGVETPASSISFMDEDNDQVRAYMAGPNPRQYGISWTSPELVEINDQIIVFSTQYSISSGWRQNLVDIWKSSEPGTWKESVTPELFARRSEYRRFGMIGDTSTWGQFALGDWEVTSVPFQFGTVNYRERRFIEAHVDIVKVLAEALSLGYVRFLNLQERDQAQEQLIEGMEKELNTAHDLQMDLMPSQTPTLAGCDFAGRCIPATHVGGDFFQYLPLAHDRLAIGLADVTGHAMEAAIPVVMFSGILKGETRYNNVLDRLFGQLNLEDLFSNLNKTLYETLHGRTFVCFAMAEFNALNRRLRFSNSGFPYPYHFSAANGSIKELSLDAYPLGIRPNTTYQVLETQLASGDYIVFCSDGIIEARNEAHEFFGFDRTAATIHQLCGQAPTAAALVDGIFGAVHSFIGSNPQDDDMTCVALNVD